MKLRTEAVRWSKPCPRCRSEASVEVRPMTRAARSVVTAGLLCFYAIGFLDTERRWLYGLFAAVLSLVLLFNVEVATCTACKAQLTQGVFGGWQ